MLLLHSSSCNLTYDISSMFENWTPLLFSSGLAVMYSTQHCFLLFQMYFSNLNLIDFQGFQAVMIIVKAKEDFLIILIPSKEKET